MKTITIGERIRDLRKKRDLTQEKLADFLGVSYQAVSKWECNLTSPDLGLIGPLTKLLGVTSDELLGLTEEECDERKAFFDEAMARFRDDELDVYARNAEAAVREFPGDMRYLTWHADCIQLLSVSEPDEKRFAMDEDIVRFADTVLENTDDEKLKQRVIRDAVYALADLGRREEARKYAELLPEGDYRESLLGPTMTGEEQVQHGQKRLWKAMWTLLMRLVEDTPDSVRIEACEAAETIVRLLIPDGNFLDAYDLLYLEKVYHALREAQTGRYEAALEDLKAAKEYGLLHDDIFVDHPGTYRYTAPLFDRIEIDTHNFQYYGVSRSIENLGSWLECRCFDPIRDTPEFQALLAGTDA